MISAQQDGDRQLTYRVDQQRTAWREVDGEGVVLDLDTSVYFGLNHSAGVLWPLLMAGATYRELIAALLDSVPAPQTAAQAEHEVANFLDALDTEHLLHFDVVE